MNSTKTKHKSSNVNTRRFQPVNKQKELIGCHVHKSDVKVVSVSVSVSSDVYGFKLQAKNFLLWGHLFNGSVFLLMKSLPVRI